MGLPSPKLPPLAGFARAFLSVETQRFVSNRLRPLDLQLALVGKAVTQIQVSAFMPCHLGKTRFRAWLLCEQK
jgi:hypothetical protein